MQRAKLRRQSSERRKSALCDAGGSCTTRRMLKKSSTYLMDGSIDFNGNDEIGIANWLE